MCGLSILLPAPQAGPPQVLRVSMNVRVLSRKSWHDIAAEDPKLSAQISERVRSGVAKFCMHTCMWM